MDNERWLSFLEFGCFNIFINGLENISFETKNKIIQNKLLEKAY